MTLSNAHRAFGRGDAAGNVRNTADVKRLQSMVASHKVPALVIGFAAAIALGFGISYAAFHGSSSTVAGTGSTGVTATTQPSPSSSAHVSANHSGESIRGALVAMSGDTWTIHTRQGQSLSILITPGTRFGSTAHPSTESGFAVGQEVRVSGNPTAASTWTARRIVLVGSA
jgi:hypothetical protein